MRIASFMFPIFILAHVSIVQAQDQTNVYNGIPDDVIERVGKKDVRGMFKVMARGTASEGATHEVNPMLDGFIKQFEAQFDDTGDFLDASFYKEEYFGTRYSLLTYVLNYANKPMALTIKMYNGKSGWRAINVQLQPEIDKFADEQHGLLKKINLEFSSWQ